MKRPTCPLGIRIKSCNNGRPALVIDPDNPNISSRKIKQNAQSTTTKKKKKAKEPNKFLDRQNVKKLGPDEEIFTVVRSLPGFVEKNDLIDLKEFIEQDALDVSALTVEASRLIYFYYTTRLQKNPLVDITKTPFRQFFISLKEKSAHKHSEQRIPRIP